MTMTRASKIQGRDWPAGHTIGQPFVRLRPTSSLPFWLNGEAHQTINGKLSRTISRGLFPTASRSVAFQSVRRSVPTAGATCPLSSIGMTRRHARLSGVILPGIMSRFAGRPTSHQSAIERPSRSAAIACTRICHCSGVSACVLRVQCIGTSNEIVMDPIVLRNAVRFKNMFLSRLGAVCNQNG